MNNSFKLLVIIITLLMICSYHIQAYATISINHNKEENIRPLWDDSDWGAPDNDDWNYYKGKKIVEKHYIWKEKFIDLYADYFKISQDEVENRMRRKGAKFIVDEIVESRGSVVKF